MLKYHLKRERETESHFDLIGWNCCDLIIRCQAFSLVYFMFHSISVPLLQYRVIDINAKVVFFMYVSLQLHGFSKAALYMCTHTALAS